MASHQAGVSGRGEDLGEHSMPSGQATSPAHPETFCSSTGCYTHEWAMLYLSATALAGVAAPPPTAIRGMDQIAYLCSCDAA